MKGKRILPLAVIAAALLSSMALAQNVAEWEANMTNFGRKHCAILQSPNVTADTKHEAIYYDAQNIFQKIRDYTNDKTWSPCEATAEKIYRDDYVLEPGTRVLGYWVFSRGALRDWQEFGDAESRRAVDVLAHKSAFGPLNISYLKSIDRARENAYLLEAELDAEKANINYSDTRRRDLANAAFGHIEQWASGTTVVKTFFVALVSQALIKNHEVHPDPRTLPAIKKAGDIIWGLWVPSAKAFKYVSAVNSDGEQPTPQIDLNLLISPVFGWLYKETKGSSYREKAVESFNAGVAGAWLGGGKQFNQNYRWSFDEVQWLKAGAATPTPVPTATAIPTRTPRPTATATPNPCAKCCGWCSTQPQPRSAEVETEQRSWWKFW
jgi:hypothetical protein